MSYKFPDNINLLNLIQNLNGGALMEDSPHPSYTPTNPATITHNMHEKLHQDTPPPDNTYLDIKVSNNGEQRFVAMSFKQTKSESYVENPSLYYLSVIRWKVPAFDFPLMLFPIQNDQSDPNLSQFSITLETSTDIFQYFLYFVPRTGAPKPDPIPANAIPTQAQSNYYFVYEYQHVVDMVNHAFQMAHDNVTGKPVGSEAPFMLYSAEDSLFSIVAQESQYGVSVTPQPPPPATPTSEPTYDADIKIFFNYQLYEFFNGFNNKTFPESTATLGRDVQIIVQNLNDSNLYAPDNTKVVMTQDFTSTSFWSPVKQIIFNTSLLPIRNEYTSVSGNSYKKILTDFEPLNDASTDLRDTLQYFPQGKYRLTDLIGTNPLYNVDLFVTWLDVNGNEYPAYVPPYQQFSAKLLFEKRSLEKNYNRIYE